MPSHKHFLLFFCFHLCVVYGQLSECFCMWVKVHFYAKESLRLVSGIILHFSCTLLIESGSLDQIQSSPVRLVSLASLARGPSVSVFWSCNYRWATRSIHHLFSFFFFAFCGSELQLLCWHGKHCNYWVISPGPTNPSFLWKSKHHLPHLFTNRFHWAGLFAVRDTDRRGGLFLLFCLHLPGLSCCCFILLLLLVSALKRSHCVAQADLELYILHPQPLYCWDDSCGYWVPLLTFYRWRVSFKEISGYAPGHSVSFWSWQVERCTQILKLTTILELEEGF